MSCDCCTNTKKPPTVANCPGCNGQGDAVGTTTLLHQLKRPWQQGLEEGDYYFCAEQECEVVYFSREGARFDDTALRTAVGQKSTEPERLICYCFDIRHSDLADEASAKQCRDFVISETRNKVCACEQRNPSGKCCLRDFPKQKE